MSTITTIDLLAILAEKKHAQMPVLLDVRNPDEWEEGIIQNAVCISLPMLPLHLSEFSPDTTYIVICRSGNRSGQACQFLMEHGIKQVLNYIDGMQGWKEKGLQVVFPN